MAHAWWRDVDYELFDRLKRERDTARAALRRYGQHESYCVSRIKSKPPETPCNCGLDAALSAPEGGRRD